MFVCLMSGYEGTGSVNLSDTLYVDEIKHEFIETDLKLQICTDSTYPLDKEIKLSVLHLCLFHTVTTAEVFGMFLFNSSKNVVIVTQIHTLKEVQ